MNTKKGKFQFPRVRRQLKTSAEARTYKEQVQVSDDELLFFLNNEYCPPGVVVRLWTNKTWYGAKLNDWELAGEFRSLDAIYRFLNNTYYDTPTPEDYDMFVIRIKTNFQRCKFKKLYGFSMRLEYKNP